MWNYVRLNRNGSPMAEILSRCTSKANISLVVYHLSENHVECATEPNVDKFNLRETARAIKADAPNNHAILAYDFGSNEVYMIDNVPELNIASAVLLCVVTELINGNVQGRDNERGIPKTRTSITDNRQKELRDSRGRFVKQQPTQGIRSFEDDSVAGFGKPDPTIPIIKRRFKIGRH